MKEYTLDSGEVSSRAAFVRQEFVKDRSRREIADDLEVPYNVVYSATANMFNSHHPESGGGGGRVIMAEHPDTGETMKRADIMRDLYEKGQTRSEIAALFEVAYGTVYGATKDTEPPEGSKAAHGGKVFIEDPETGEEVARVDFIREKFAEGWTRRQIADAVGCDYSVVWMATREEDEDETDEEVEETEE